MSTSEWIFVIMLIINTMIAIVYFLWGILAHKKNEYDENQRISYIIRAVCILICPMIVLLFFVVGMLIKFIFFRTEVDLSDVIFNKERVKQLAKADEEREKNVVPIQDALAVSDHTNLRTLMLNVIKGNINQSLSSISLALDSEDSEASHYAASVLSKELNEFRLNVRKIQQEIKKIEENEEDTISRDIYGILLIDYMNKVLKQHVFTTVEQEYFVEIMADTGEMVYQDELVRKEDVVKQEIKKTEEETKQSALDARQYAEIALRLIENKNYERARIWCNRALENFPLELSSYQCMMKLLFILEDKEGFLKTLQQLKKSGIVIDNATLEMIRIFQ